MPPVARGSLAFDACSSPRSKARYESDGRERAAARHKECNLVSVPVQGISEILPRSCIFIEGCS